MEIVRGVGLMILAGIVGYVAGAFGTGFAITKLSSNCHDRSQEAAMTGGCVGGPIAGLICAVVAGIYYWKG